MSVLFYHIFGAEVCRRKVSPVHGDKYARCRKRVGEYVKVAG